MGKLSYNKNYSKTVKIRHLKDYKDKIIIITGDKLYLKTALNYVESHFANYTLTRNNSQYTLTYNLSEYKENLTINPNCKPLLLKFKL